MRSVLSWLAALGICAATSPAVAAWHEAKSKHFIVYADDPPERLRAFADRLERFDQAVRLVRGMDDPPLTEGQRLIVYALKNFDAVGDLAGSNMVAGFYIPRASGAVAFVPSRSRSDSVWDLDADAVFFHEYAHHLQLQRTEIALPAWIVEGFAEFFATSEIKNDGSIGIGAAPNYRAWGMFVGAGVTLEDVLGGSYRSSNAREADEFYARSWLIVHYLTFEPARKGQLTRYISAIQSGMPAIDAARNAFGDLKTLNRELERYKAQRTILGITIDPNVLSVGSIEVRPLAAGEAASIPVRMRSDRGVDEKLAPKVAADARRIAAQFPKDLAVQNALAEAEYDAGNYAAAQAAADSALAINPNSTHALIYKGRALVELAKKDPATANWASIRSFFIKANKQDTEDAEPLMLYYKSYLDAGTKPSQNAVDGLLYAVALAPQDPALRMNAVRQMLSDSRLQDTKQLFAPLAFDPHASQQWRETANKVMDAIAAGDGKAALGLLEKPKQAATAQ